MGPEIANFRAIIGMAYGISSKNFNFEHSDVPGQEGHEGGVNLGVLCRKVRVRSRFMRANET